MQFYLAEGNMIFSLISRNIAGQTKKSTALAMTFIAWAAGNMTAPQVCIFPRIDIGAFFFIVSYPFYYYSLTLKLFPIF